MVSECELVVACIKCEIQMSGPIDYKYHEGNMKRTLERELEELEIELFEAGFLDFIIILLMQYSIVLV